VHNGSKFFKDQHCKQFAWIVKEAFSNIEPLWALVLRVMLWLGRRWGGEMLRGPSQHQCLYALLREQSKKFGMPGFGLSKRGYDSVQMGSNRLQEFWQHRSIDRFDQAEPEQQLGADARDRTEPTDGRTEVEGVVEQMEQESKWSVARYGLLPRMMGVFLVWETLVERGLAGGVGECGRGFVLLGNSRIGLALQVAAPVTEVSTLRKPITHPARVLARRMRASPAATAPIGGHAEAVEAVMPEVVKRGVPGLGRALRGQWDVQDGRTLRLNRDQEGLMAGKNLIAQIQHHGGLCPREG